MARGAPKQSERGAALVVVAILLVALLGLGAVFLRLQTADTRSTGIVRDRREALFCAEAGLAHARRVVGLWGATGLWDNVLSETTDDDPPNYPIEGDLDGDGLADYRVVVADNGEGDGDPTRDTDLRLFLVSSCIRPRATPETVKELVVFEGSPNAYRWQGSAGAWGTNNRN